MKTIKNAKNTKIETLCKRLVELEEIMKPYKDEMDMIKNEIKARDPQGEYTFETEEYTVTSRVAESTRVDSKKVKALPNYNELTTVSISHIVKVNKKGSRK
jgi:predicted phage-related endonuclease